MTCNIVAAVSGAFGLILAHITAMNTNTLLIILVLILLFGGGGFYFRRR